MTTLEPSASLDARIAEWMGWTDGPHTLYLWHDRKKRENPRHGAFHQRPQLPNERWSRIGDYSCYVNEAGEKFYCGKPKEVYWPLRWSRTDDAAGRVLDTLVERGYEPALVYSSEMGGWQCGVAHDEHGLIEGCPCQLTRALAVVAVVLKLMEAQDDAG